MKLLHSHAKAQMKIVVRVNVDKDKGHTKDRSLQINNLLSPLD
jgi:hypothetical protein